MSVDRKKSQRRLGRGTTHSDVNSIVMKYCPCPQGVIYWHRDEMICVNSYNTVDMLEEIQRATALGFCKAKLFLKLIPIGI